MTISAADKLLLGAPEYLQIAAKRAIGVCPEFVKLAFKPVATDTLKIQGIKDASGVFRAYNEGVDNDTGTPLDLTFTNAIFDASFWVDPAQGDKYPFGGIAGLTSKVGDSKLFNGLVSIARQVWDGNGVSPNMSGFSRYVPAGNVVDGGADAGDTCADVWLVCSEDSDGVGIQFAQVQGEGETGLLKVGDVENQVVQGTNNKNLRVKFVPVMGYPGVYAFNTSLMVKIEGAESTNIDDDLIGTAAALFPDGYTPNAIFMGKAAREWLRKSRTATNAAGTPAPAPMDWNGIPIFETAGLPSYIPWTPSIPAGNVAAAGGTKAITMAGGTHSDAVLAFSVEAGKTWLTLDKATCAASGTVTATAAVNSGSQRTAKVYVTEGSKIVTEITVTQAAAT